MCIALLMATWHILSLLDFFQEILGLLSSGLGGLFLMGIFFPRIGGKAALTGFVCGVGAVFAVRYFTDTSFLLYGCIGMATSVAVGLVCSALSGSTNHSPDCAGKHDPDARERTLFRKTCNLSYLFSLKVCQY